MSLDHLTSFANGRYQVKRVLGEGGKKKVYLAHDTLLDLEVAFALIKTAGLDETSGRPSLVAGLQLVRRIHGILLTRPARRFRLRPLISDSLEDSRRGRAS